MIRSVVYIFFSVLCLPYLTKVKLMYIDALKAPSMSFNGLLNIDNEYFEQMVYKIHIKEPRLNSLYVIDTFPFY